MLGNRLLVRRLKPPTTSGGIYIPESLQDDANVGGPKEFLVLGKGPGLTNAKGRLIPIEVNCGDRVICHSYLTGAVPLHDVEGLFIITADQVLAAIPNESNHMPKDKNKQPGKPGSPAAALPSGTILTPDQPPTFQLNGASMQVNLNYRLDPGASYQVEGTEDGTTWVSVGVPIVVDPNDQPMFWGTPLIYAENDGYRIKVV